MDIGASKTTQKQIERFARLLKITPKKFIENALTCVTIEYQEEGLFDKFKEPSDYQFNFITYQVTITKTTEELIYEITDELGIEVEDTIERLLKLMVNYFDDMLVKDIVEEEDLITYGWDISDLPMKYRIWVVLISNIQEKSWYKTFLKYD